MCFYNTNCFSWVFHWNQSMCIWFSIWRWEWNFWNLCSWSALFWHFSRLLFDCQFFSTYCVWVRYFLFCHVNFLVRLKTLSSFCVSLICLMIFLGLYVSTGAVLLFLETWPNLIEQLMVFLDLGNRIFLWYHNYPRVELLLKCFPIAWKEKAMVEVYLFLVRFWTRESFILPLFHHSTYYFTVWTRCFVVLVLRYISVLHQR